MRLDLVRYAGTFFLWVHALTFRPKDQSRRCPLCSQPIGEYLIHHLRSKYDYTKHYLTPLVTSPRPSQRPIRTNTRRRPEREWGQRERRAAQEAHKLERALTRRRWIYQHNLYAKVSTLSQFLVIPFSDVNAAIQQHVASNSYTRYRPYPSPAQFASSPDLIARMTAFLRRELRVWVNLDVEVRPCFTLP
jgi:E3 ubiquitin-protein ligase Topors